MKSDPTPRHESSETKTQAYSSLYSINHAFEEIAEHLKRLEDQVVLPPGFAEAYRVAIEESRAGINHAVLGRMLETEQNDWAYFGRLKIARERAENE